MQQPEHNYYYGNEAEQYTFYRFPKALFTNDRYKNLSDGAKILYGLMLDRMGLSLKNCWLDKKNWVFIYFTLEKLQEYMNCGHNKGVKLMAELDNIGLIERVKQGLGKPAIVGQGMVDDAPAFRNWWHDIKEEYNVRANIGIDGKNYNKYGTNFGIQMLVIDKNGATLEPVKTDFVDNVLDLQTILGGIRNNRPDI